MDTLRHAVLQRLAMMVRRLVERSAVNKMTVHNFAVVLAPVLMRARTDDDMAAVAAVGDEIDAVATIFDNVDVFFPEPYRDTPLGAAWTRRRAFVAPPPLSGTEWAQLEARGSLRTYAAGETVVAEGSWMQRRIYRIHRGECVSRCEADGGQETPLIELDVFGAMAALGADVQSPATVVASRRSEIVSIPVDQLDSLFALAPTIVRCR